MSSIEELDAELARMEQARAAAAIRRSEALARPTPLADARLRASIAELETPAWEQRTDRLGLAIDQAYNDLGVLMAKLAPVLGRLDFPADGDDPQPPAAPPVSGMAAALLAQTVSAEYLAEKIRAITAAVDL